MSSAMTITMSSAHSTNLSVTLPTSQLILQPFRLFPYVTAHSSTLPLFHLRHSSFSNPSFASPTSQALYLIHLASRPCLTCEKISRKNLVHETCPDWGSNPGPLRDRAHSPTFTSLHLRHNSFSNPSYALHTSPLILQPFRCFTYVTVHYPTLLLFLLHHKFFT